MHLNKLVTTQIKMHLNTSVNIRVNYQGAAVVDKNIGAVMFLFFSGLGICILAEFGRFLCYNLMVDEDQQENGASDTGSESENDDLRGYEQLILILQSQCVETGKSFFCELLSRIFHGRKQDIHSVLSFESAKVMLSKGQPVIIGKLLTLVWLLSPT